MQFSVLQRLSLEQTTFPAFLCCICSFVPVNSFLQAAVHCARPMQPGSPGSQRFSSSAVRTTYTPCPHMEFRLCESRAGGLHTKVEPGGPQALIHLAGHLSKIV
jgi:hypothetical protein